MTALLQRRNVLVSPLLAFAAASFRGHVADAGRRCSVRWTNLVSISS